MKNVIFLGLLFSLCFSCSKEEKVYSPIELWNMAVAFDPKVELVPIPNHEAHRRVVCSQYGAGCIKGSGKRVLVRKVELIVIQFNTEEDAKKEAARLGQWYARNWLLDDVHNEPVLEDFVVRAFKAKKGQAL